MEVTPLARIAGFADAEQQPIEFTTAPAKAIPKALRMAGLDIDDVDSWEVNLSLSQGHQIHWHHNLILLLLG